MTLPLSLAALPDLPDAVDRPGYGRDDLSPGILHIGVGNFHRAHQAVYLDRLFGRGRDHDWALVGAGIKPFDADRRAQMEGQDWLTTVVDLDPDGYSARVIGPMVDFLRVDGRALTACIADARIRIVSLTITEGGYFVDTGSGAFDAGHPDIRADAADQGTPETVFGLLCAGLKARRAAGLPGLTILSCDNLPENGDIARQAVLGMAGLIDTDLRDWIAGHVTFPNSMVDCITPATTDRERALVRDRFGIADATPVVCEPFRQWVIEDKFAQGRPALEEVGVQFVEDVTPYETMKLSILNAGHAAIAYPGALLGHHFVHEAMEDPLIVAWLRHLMVSEVIPVLPALPGSDYHAYLDTCIARFANPAIGDTVARLCLDGSNRQPKFVLPTVGRALKADAPVDALALEVALWCHYLARSADPAAGITVEDDNAGLLVPAASRAASDPQAFLSIEQVFGRLGENRRFADAFAAHLDRLAATSVRAVLEDVAGVARTGDVTAKRHAR